MTETIPGAMRAYLAPTEELAAQAVQQLLALGVRAERHRAADFDFAAWKKARCQPRQVLTPADPWPWDVPTGSLRRCRNHRDRLAAIGPSGRVGALHCADCKPAAAAAYAAAAREADALRSAELRIKIEDLGLPKHLEDLLTLADVFSVADLRQDLRTGVKLRLIGPERTGQLADALAAWDRRRAAP